MGLNVSRAHRFHDRRADVDVDRLDAGGVATPIMRNDVWVLA
jgi:hypothetical protein